MSSTIKRGLEDHLERIKKAVSIAVLFSLVLSSCGRDDSANLVRRNDNNIVATVAVKQDGDEERITDGSHVANANGNTWTDGSQATDMGKRLRLAETKEEWTQGQGGSHFSNLLSLNEPSLKVVEQPRIEEAVTGQMQIGRYDNEGIDKGIDKTKWKAFRFPELASGKALSFHGYAAPRDDSTWRKYIEKRVDFWGTKDGVKELQSRSYLLKEKAWFEFLEKPEGLEFLTSDSKHVRRFLLSEQFQTFWTSDYAMEFLLTSENGRKFLMSENMEAIWNSGRFRAFLTSYDRLSSVKLKGLHEILTSEYGKRLWNTAGFKGLLLSESVWMFVWSTDDGVKLLTSGNGRAFLVSDEGIEIWNSPEWKKFLTQWKGKALAKSKGLHEILISDDGKELWNTAGFKELLLSENGEKVWSTHDGVKLLTSRNGRKFWKSKKGIEVWNSPKWEKFLTDLDGALLLRSKGLHEILISDDGKELWNTTGFKGLLLSLRWCSWAWSMDDVEKLTWRAPMYEVPRWSTDDVVKLLTSRNGRKFWKSKKGIEIWNSPEWKEFLTSSRGLPLVKSKELHKILTSDGGEGLRNTAGFKGLLVSENGREVWNSPEWKEFLKTKCIDYVNRCIDYVNSQPSFFRKHIESVVVGVVMTALTIVAAPFLGWRRIREIGTALRGAYSKRFRE